MPDWINGQSVRFQLCRDRFYDTILVRRALADHSDGTVIRIKNQTCRWVKSSSIDVWADRQGRRGVIPLWSNGKNGKEYRATLGRKAIAGIFSVGLEEEYRWKDSRLRRSAAW